MLIHSAEPQIDLGIEEKPGIFEGQGVGGVIESNSYGMID